MFIVKSISAEERGERVDEKGLMELLLVWGHIKAVIAQPK